MLKNKRQNLWISADRESKKERSKKLVDIFNSGSGLQRVGEFHMLAFENTGASVPEKVERDFRKLLEEIDEHMKKF